MENSFIHWALLGRPNKKSFHKSSCRGKTAGQKRINQRSGGAIFNRNSKRLKLQKTFIREKQQNKIKDFRSSYNYRADRAIFAR